MKLCLEFKQIENSLFFCEAVILAFYDLKMIINSRLSFSAGYYSAPNFLQFKEFELYWGAVFLRSGHTFSWFLKSNWSSDFGHAETGRGAKKWVVLRRDFFRSNFKVERENDFWTKIRFLASGFFVYIRQFHFDFYCFYSIFGLDF